MKYIAFAGVVIALAAGVADAAPTKPAHKAPVAGQVPVPNVLINLFTIASENYRARANDKFAPQKPFPAVLGTPVHIERRVVATKGVETDFDGTTATISAGGDIFGLELTETIRNLGSYVGSNAFGAQRAVRKTLRLAYGLNLSRDPSLRVRREGLSGPQARDFLNSAILVIDGAIEKDSEGLPASCLKTIDEATIDDPIEETALTCNVSIRPTRFAFIDARDHSVIAEWKPDEAPAAE